MVSRDIDVAPPARPRITRAVAIGLLGAFVLWLVAYVSGVWPWLGYEAWTTRSAEVGPGHVIIGRDRAGGNFGFGLGTFVFFAGQTVVVSYDADIRRGCLWLHVWPLVRPAPADHVSQCVTASGKGEWTVPIPKTGAYVINVDASVIKGTGPGWDMDYAVWWGARW